MKQQSVRLNETLEEVDRMEKPGQINSLTTHESNGISNKLSRWSQLAAGELRALHHHFELSSCNIDVKRH